MVKKFTVSVSDELASRFERWKGDISPSKVFQAALEEALGRKEGFRQRITEENDMDTIIERLRQEKRVDENSYNEMGRREGLRWAKSASYSELRYAAETFPRDEGHYGARAIYQDDVLSAYWAEDFNEDPALTADADDEYMTDEAEAWLDGWFEAVDEFWAEVQRRL